VAGRGGARLGSAGRGMAGRGMAGHGMARLGMARIYLPNSLNIKNSKGETKCNKLKKTLTQSFC